MQVSWGYGFVAKLRPRFNVYLLFILSQFFTKVYLMLLHFVILESFSCSGWVSIEILPPQLMNSVGRFCLPLCVCVNYCRQACLALAPWALLRVLWAGAYRGLSLNFLSLFPSFFAVLQLAWYHGSRSVLVYRDVSFPSYMWQVILCNSNNNWMPQPSHYQLNTH